MKALSEDGKTITVGRDAAPKGSRKRFEGGCRCSVKRSIGGAATFLQCQLLGDPCHRRLQKEAWPANCRSLSRAIRYPGCRARRILKVYAVHWAGSELIDATYAPSRRYNFRVAAYNKAGFSPFVYYDFELKRIRPRFRPFGGQNFEIELVGGGAEAKPSDYKVFFVPAPLGYDVTSARSVLAQQSLT